jgi:hypothetical protein
MGIGLSYENIDLGEGHRMAPINAMFLVRLMPESHWTPTFQFGGGGAKTAASERYENSTFKAGAGVDYFIKPTLALGPQVNYYYFSHAGGTSAATGHLVGFNLALTYFFGI